MDKLFVSNINKEIAGKKIKKDFCIYVGLFLFGKIKILNTKITDERLEKINKNLKIRDRIEKLDFKNLKVNLKLDKETLEALKEIKIRVSKFSLNLEIGTENVIFTSILVTLLSTVFSIVLSRVLEKEAINNSQYLVTPIYHDKNLLKIEFDCIINLKMVHIIYIMFHLLKKGRVSKDGRTSNRRPYDYSYE